MISLKFQISLCFAFFTVLGCSDNSIPSKFDGLVASNLNHRVDQAKAKLDTLAIDDKAGIDAIVAESKSLLEEIEGIRRLQTSTEIGPLGDAWWACIKLKTDAVKLQRGLGSESVDEVSGVEALGKIEK